MIQNMRVIEQSLVKKRSMIGLLRDMDLISSQFHEHDLLECLEKCMNSCEDMLIETKTQISINLRRKTKSKFKKNLRIH